MKYNLILCLRGTFAAVFILRRLTEEYHAKGKMLNKCSVEIENAFDRVPRKVLEWAIRKKGIPEVFVRSLMSLHEGAKTRIRVDSELSEEFDIKVNLPEGALSELLYVDDLVLMSETIEGLRNKFFKWKETFESKGLKVNLGKTNVMVSDRITKDGLSKSNVVPCGVCCLGVKANSVLCVQCGRWIHGRCAGLKRMTPNIPTNFTCKKCERNIGEALEQE